MRFQYTVIATITVTKWVEFQTTLTKNIPHSLAFGFPSLGFCLPFRKIVDIQNG